MTFPEEVFVTKLAWSPDGTEIAFDAAPQLSFQGDNYYLIGDSTRSELGVVRSDGTSQRRLAGPPASSPSWAVSPVLTPPGKPSVQMTRHGNDLTFNLGNLTVGRPVEIEATADFQQWTVAQRFQASAAQQLVRLPFSSTAGESFFRVILR